MYREPKFLELLFYVVVFGVVLVSSIRDRPLDQARRLDLRMTTVGVIAVK